MLPNNNFQSVCFNIWSLLFSSHLLKAELFVEQLKQKALNGTLSSQDAEHPPPASEGKQAYFAYFDSIDLHWCPDIGTVYTVEGQQIKVRLPGYQNPWYALFGNPIYPSGEGVYTIHTNKRHQEVETHLQLLIDLDPDAFWFVVFGQCFSPYHKEIGAVCPTKPEPFGAGVFANLQSVSQLD